MERRTFSHPKTRFISTFIGEANLFHGQRKSGTVTLRNKVSFGDDGADEDIVCVVRPEKIQLEHRQADSIADCDFHYRAKVLDSVFLGPFVQYTLENQFGEHITVDTRDMDQRKHVNLGDDVLIGWKQSDQIVLADK